MTRLTRKMPTFPWVLEVRFLFSPHIVPWCNGITTDFGSVRPGSNPGGTTMELWQIWYMRWTENPVNVVRVHKVPQGN